MNIYIKGKVLDVTKFIRTHPGGSKALKIFQNRDATEQFISYHSSDAHKKLDAMLRHAPDAPRETNLPSTSAIGKDFDAMRQSFISKGFFEPDIRHELFKLFLTLAPGTLGAYMLQMDRPCLGALFIAFSFYLCGWTAHDYLHHGVFSIGGSSLQNTEPIFWNNMFGFLLGMWQGYSPAWRRARHNTHHLTTNEIGNDPDIKTAPMLTFTRGNADIIAMLNFVQRWQEYYYIPFMCLLDLYWRVESLQYCTRRMLKDAWIDYAMMLIHYITLSWVFANPDGSGVMWEWLVFMSLVRGFLTGIVVFSTHYGEELIHSDHSLTLVEQTSHTSRNITGGYIVNILTGYISLQTEHHLFPTMPTSHLDKCQPFVKAFFKKHKLKYRESNLVECVKFNIAALRVSYLPGQCLVRHGRRKGYEIGDGLDDRLHGNRLGRVRRESSEVHRVG